MNRYLFVWHLKDMMKLLILFFFQQVVINSSVTIIDSPRFRHRGAMLDSARHFLPISIIKKNLVRRRRKKNCTAFILHSLSPRMQCHIINSMFFIGILSMINHFHSKVKHSQISLEQ